MISKILLLIPVLLSFFVTFLVLPFWIRKSKQIGLLWEDMNKFSHQKVAGSGGLIAVLGFVLGVLVFIAYRTFVLKTSDSLIEILSLLSPILVLAGIGFLDDLLGWRRGGLSRRSRLILVAFAAIPLMAINAGRSDIFVPFAGSVDFGILYPLLIIPIGVIGAATTFNFLAGYNGLEAGQGILLLSAISIVSYYTQNPWISIISLCMAASLLAFLFFNFYPAKVFPGDSLTYAVGGLIAISSILGNFEKVALLFFTPYIIETILKSRGKLEKHSFGKPLSDGSLDLKYEKIYGLEHLSIYLMKKFNIKPTEKKVVYSIWIFQALIIIAGFIIFWDGIFNYGF
jgi:UDP-N-acetylglucosamine--dolichyl-phosphate N-acetylglucosaminephosphotransferase